ncbi:MAG: hypothetical protein VYA87_04065 [SAR324 cluster bacterium]|nr:hypothetical protein [SAR324 cluster bacterium]
MEISVETIDYGSFEKLLKVLSSPYVVPEEHSEYLISRKPDELVPETFVELLSFTQKRSSGLAAGYGLIVEWSSLPTWAIGYS